MNNPLTGAAYTNNTIPTINPVAAAVLSHYPLPNANGNGYNYQTLVPIPSNSDGWDLRVDETVSQKQSVYARFSWKNLLYTQGGSGLTANQFLPNVTAHDQNGMTGGASATFVGPVAKPEPPKSTSLPALRGTARAGHTMTTSNGSWSSALRAMIFM